jgi:CheY-like chemotaxis protein
MTVRVLVVDDEPDVETLFRQQFRREVRQELYTLDFALSGKAALDILDGHIGEQLTTPLIFTPPRKYRRTRGVL